MLIVEQQQIKNRKETEEGFCDLQFVDCIFEKCSFNEVRLKNCLFKNCCFKDCRISNPILEMTIMSNCEFDHCQCLGISWSEVQCNPIGPISVMKHCQLRYNNFNLMKLHSFDFQDNEIVDSSFYKTDLSSGSFKGCTLNNTEFQNCNLNKTSFLEAVGYRIDIMSCTMKNALFSFPEAMTLLNSLGIIVK